MDTKTADHPTPEAPPNNRFFAWLRSLDLQREPGWIGGVCAGIAAKLGIDPLIVRGIVVVVAVLGGPALILYAAAWLLLPDRSDVIHLEQLTRGTPTPALAGIGSFALLALLPVTQGFWSLGARYWGAPQWGESVGRALWTVAVLALLVWFVAWIVRRAQSPFGTPATTDDKPETIPTEPTAGEPIKPAPDASAEDFVAWREQQAAFKAANDAFKAEEALTARDAAAQRAAELTAKRRIEHETYIALALERRRLKRAANPRLAASWVWVILGLAIVASGVAALVASTSNSWTGTIGGAGLAAATLAIGLGIVAAGLARRRSGFLSFVGFVLVLLLVPLAFVPGDRTLLGEISVVHRGSYSQPFGHTTIEVDPDSTGTVDLWQGAGNVTLYINKGAGAHLTAEQRSGTYYETVLLGAEADGTESLGDFSITPTQQTASGHVLSRDVGTPGANALQVRIHQGSGSVSIEYDDPRADAPSADEESN